MFAERVAVGAGVPGVAVAVSVPVGDGETEAVGETLAVGEAEGEAAGDGEAVGDPVMAMMFVGFGVAVLAVEAALSPSSPPRVRKTAAASPAISTSTPMPTSATMRVMRPEPSAASGRSTSIPETRRER